MTSNDTQAVFKLVASDLDGTLLTPNHQVSDLTKQTLQQLHRQGITFAFATGRHHIDVAGIREQVGIPAYMITSNGARVHDANDNLLYSNNVPEHLVQSIINLVQDDPEMKVHIYQGDQWLLNQEDEAIRQFHNESGFNYQLFDSAQAPSTDIAKIFFTHPGHDHDHLVEYEKKLNDTFGDQIYVVFSTPWCLEVMAAGVSKGEALNAVARHLTYKLEDCIAFGDGMNDVEMLSMAGKGLVMGSAHHKVFDALPSQEIIGTNSEEAVAQYLRKHILV